MGYFKIRRSLNIGGGSVQLGADVNIYRSAANVLKTDDSLTTAGYTLTADKILNASSGTAAYLPYHTATPTVAVNGHFTMMQKGNRSYLLYYAGGTPCHIMLPQTTHGTVTITVGGTP